MTPPATAPGSHDGESDSTTGAAGRTLSLSTLRLLRWRVWISESFRPSELETTLFWAGVIGLVCALASVGFQSVTDGLRSLLTGQDGEITSNFSRLTWWQCLLVPTVGGLFAGGLLYAGSRLLSPKRGGDYMEAITLGDGVISARGSLVRIGSAMFSIASGASIGREGPLVQLAAMLASLIGRWRRVPAPRLRLYVACGAAAGIASAYNAPIGGALFVSEIILCSIAMETFGPLVFSSVVATLTIHQIHGANPLYKIGMPTMHIPSGLDIIPFMVLGLLAGALAPLFLLALRSMKGLFDRLKLPLYIRLAVGGLVVGSLAILHPEVAGNGYTIIDHLLREGWATQILIGILVFKLLATSVSFGSGAVGGVFTPTLCVGATLGYLFTLVVNPLWPGAAFETAPFTLVGMGALLSATTLAPLMAIILVFEMTLNYDIILPLMMACVISWYTSRAFKTHAIYADAAGTPKDRHYERRLAALRVSDLMKPDPPAVSQAASFADVAQMLVSNRHIFLYVIDTEARFQGAISLHDIKEFLHNPDLSRHIIADDILRSDFPSIRPDATLAEAMVEFTGHQGDRLPVVSGRPDNRLLGSLSKSDLILAIADRTAVGPEAASESPGRA